MSQTAIVLALFVATGVSIPLLVNLLQYNGACESSTMLFLFPNYVGMAAAFFTSKPSKLTIGGAVTPKKQNLWGLLLLLCLIGLVYAGSAIFSVIYNSVTIYTAILSRIFLNRKIQCMQWFGISIVALGLSITSLARPVSQPDEDQSQFKLVTLGIILVIIGSLFHAVVYILSEIILTSYQDTISPELLSSIMGSFGCAVFGFWQLVYTIPNYKTLILDQISSHNGNTYIIVTAYMCIVLSSLVHALCFFRLLHGVGSTTTGILKGVQSITLFVLSHIFFCSTQESQCFTQAKGVALVLVLLGVALYSAFQSTKAEKVDDQGDIASADEERLLLVRHDSLRRTNSPPALRNA